MPNEMTPQEIAERLENKANTEEAVYHIFGADGLDNGDILMLHSAAAIACRVADGELVPMVHGHWIRVDDFTSECSHCGNAFECDIEDNPPYCDQCGALMDGKDGEK